MTPIVQDDELVADEVGHEREQHHDDAPRPAMLTRLGAVYGRAEVAAVAVRRCTSSRFGRDEQRDEQHDERQARGQAAEPLMSPTYFVDSAARDADQRGRRRT